MHGAILIAAWALASPTASQAELAWDEALALFEQAKAKLDDRAEAVPLFQKAAEKFAEAETAGMRRPALYRNLGNSWYLADRLPEAILAYRQGLALDPGDADLRDALDIARSKVLRVDDKHGLAEPLAWPTSLPWPGYGGLLGAFVVGWSMACILALVAWRRWSSGYAIAAACLAIFALGFAATWRHVHDRSSADDLVVLRDDGIALRRGNGVHFPPHPDLPVLRRGMEARRLHERGVWLQVRFASGEIGWLPRDAVAMSSSRGA